MYIADLHTHSRYSRATSKECTPEYLDLWAAQKRHPSDRERGFYASGMERRVKRKIKARRRRILCAEKRIQDSGWEHAGSHDSPICDHRRDQFYL